MLFFSLLVARLTALQLQIKGTLSQRFCWRFVKILLKLWSVSFAHKEMLMEVLKHLH